MKAFTRLEFGLVFGFLMTPVIAIASEPGAPAGEGAKIPPPAAAAAPKEQALTRTDVLFQRAARGAELFLDSQARALALSQIAAAQSRVGERDASRATFRQAVALAKVVTLDEATYTPHVLLLIAKAQMREGFRDEAEETSRQCFRIAKAPVKREFVKGQLYSDIVRFQRKIGDDAGIQETLREARQFYFPNKGGHIDTFAVSHFAQLQAISGDLAGAWRLVCDPASFQGADARSRRQAMFSVVQDIGKGDQESAGPVLDEALRLVPTHDEPFPYSRRYSQNSELAEIALAQARLGQFDAARKTARAIDTETPPELRDDSQRTDYSDTQKFRKAQTFGTIGQEQAKAGKHTGAQQSAAEVVRIVKTIHGNQYKDSPLEMALLALVEVGDYAGALRIADTMPLSLPSESYERIAVAQLASGDQKGARATRETALRLTRNRLEALDPDDPNRDLSMPNKGNGLRSDVAYLQAQLGDIDGAIQTAHSIGDIGDQYNALIRVAEVQAASNDLDGAMKLVETINAPQFRAQAFQALVRVIPWR